MHPTLPSLHLAVAPLERVLLGGDGPVPPPIASELRAIATRLRDLAASGANSGSTLRREGEYWTFAHDGTVLRIRHSKGVVQLAQLLAHPDTELPALVLEADVTGEKITAAPRLDPSAKAAYRARLAALRAEIADADRRGDPNHAAVHASEVDALVRELAAGVGLDGRDRNFASAAERARVNVTRNIRTAIDRVAEGDATLGRHLATSVRTGTFCCYAPDPASAIRWTVAP